MGDLIGKLRVSNVWTKHYDIHASLVKNRLREEWITKVHGTNISLSIFFWLPTCSTVPWEVPEQEECHIIISLSKDHIRFWPHLLIILLIKEINITVNK